MHLLDWIFLVGIIQMVLLIVALAELRLRHSTMTRLMDLLDHITEERHNLQIQLQELKVEEEGDGT